MKPYWSCPRLGTQEHQKVSSTKPSLDLLCTHTHWEDYTSTVSGLNPDYRWKLQHISESVRAVRNMMPRTERSKAFPGSVRNIELLNRRRPFVRPAAVLNVRPTAIDEDNSTFLESRIGRLNHTHLSA